MVGSQVVAVVCVGFTVWDLENGHISVFDSINAHSNFASPLDKCILIGQPIEPMKIRLLTTLFLPDGIVCHGASATGWSTSPDGNFVMN